MNVYRAELIQIISTLLGDKNMKNTILIGFIVIFAAVSLFSCASGDQNTSNSTNVSRNSLPGGVSNTSNSAMNSNTANSNSVMNSNANQTASVKDTFWTKTAQGGMAEVELGKLASSKAQNAEVKSFAQKMVTDHTKANDELKALATEKNVTLPTTLDSAHQSTIDEMKNLSGAEFDKEYVNAMVKDHEADVQLFEKQADDNSDPDAKAFAAKTLPTLRMHLDMIKKIQAKMK
jgi:putative membrane protein